MRICCWCKDGGPESRVWSFTFIEIKWLFSIMLLKFEDGSREAYHDHAFNSVSWLFTGRLVEEHKDGPLVTHTPSWRPIMTYRDTFHKVTSCGKSWVLTFRGPWVNTWKEWLPKTGESITLTHGRKVVGAA